MVTQETVIPCPYTVGTEFWLCVTPTSGAPFEIQAKITRTFTPFTVSQVMKISLTPGSEKSAHVLPSELVLKLYDRRYALDLREKYKAKQPTYESEERYKQFVESGLAPNGVQAIEKELDAVWPESDRYEDCPPCLIEHLLAAKMSPYPGFESSAYHRLATLRGRGIPNFYGSTSFVDASVGPGLDPLVLGLLLEFIPGSSLSDIGPESPGLDSIIRDALRIVAECGNLGLLNNDVRLGNFIVKPDCSVTMIDFAQGRFRREDEDDEEWRSQKWSADEEGCLGFAAKRKFNWEYTRSWRYALQPDKVTYS